jgi:transposase InsO family protein
MTTDSTTSFESPDPRDPHERLPHPQHPLPPQDPDPGGEGAGDEARGGEAEPGLGHGALPTGIDGLDGGRPVGPEEALASIGAPQRRRRRTRRTVPQDAAGRLHFTPRQRLLLLDTWLRSKLPAKDFAALVGVSPHSLYKWKARFEADGPAGLATKPKGKPGSRIPDATKRAILMLKQAHPDWGQDRIHDILLRTEGFAASPGAIGRLLVESGYVVQDVPTRPHPDKPRRFERARPNQMWQSDLFTFVLKRETRRVHMVVFLDDHSRFVVGWGLHASASGALVQEVFESGVANFGAPEEVLTDNGAQYHTWRGKSAFRKLLDKRGIHHIVARPRHPQTLGKTERFWQTLWGECVQQAIFRGLEDARVRIAHFVSWYNFQRPHQGIGGSVPADRFFEAESEVRRALQAQVSENALAMAREGEPRKPVYLAGRVGGEQVTLHGEGERVILTRADGGREEVDLGAPGRREVLADPGPPPSAEGAAPPDHVATEEDSRERPPGESPLDGALRTLAENWQSADPCDGNVSDEGDQA